VPWVADRSHTINPQSVAQARGAEIVTSETKRQDTDQASADEAESLIAAETRDVKQRAREARATYERVRGTYQDYARKVESVLQECLDAKKIRLHSITSRAKGPDSYERKAAQLSPESPGKAKYSDPMEQITDKAGVRIITYFLDTVDEVSTIISDQFEVLQQERKVSDDPTRFGYQSTHYLVKFLSNRAMLPEYAKFADLVAEIQVRTILQHAWAEIEHDIQYKSSSVLPTTIRRRFAALAGLIEIADREFQAIDNENIAVQAEARQRIDLGDLETVEITADSIRAYLDKTYYPDGRMSTYSYQWVARLLLHLGFTSLKEVEDCITGYDDDAVSRAAFNSRRGQIGRFEAVLLASMGDAFMLAHPLVEDNTYSDWYPRYLLQQFNRMKEHGIRIGDYRPSHYPESAFANSVYLDSVRQRLAAEQLSKRARKLGELIPDSDAKKESPTQSIETPQSPN
jgi:ppGpp synthetase/RelA/SpoT-type nucleotidyltranferase